MRNFSDIENGIGFDGKPMYYDRYGKPLKLLEWGKLFEDFNYKIIKQEDLENGLWVSTVWLGMDHSFNGGPPLIFETMVFNKKFPKKWEFAGREHESHPEMDTERYSTLQQAIEGHQLMIIKWKGYENDRDPEPDQQDS